jgi:hypothetical protein
MPEEIVELTPEELIDYAKLAKRNAIEKALLDAHSAKIAYEASIETPAPVDPRQARNAIIAGSGEKARLLGDISTEPTYTADDLEAFGFARADAEAIISEATALRTFATAVAPIGAQR